jgi:hypothetical protein
MQLQISVANVAFASHPGSIIDGAGKAGPSRLSRRVKPYDFCRATSGISTRSRRSADEARSPSIDLLLAHRIAFGLLLEQFRPENRVVLSYSIAGSSISAMRLPVKREGVWSRG